MMTRRAQRVLTVTFLVLTALWVMVMARPAHSYEGNFQPVADAEPIVKKQGMVIHRMTDGPVRCYVVVTEARMIGFQSSISCVISEKKENPHVHQSQSSPRR